MRHKTLHRTARGFANPRICKPVVFFFLFFYLASCTKTEYRTVDNPAYIRVFNSLMYEVSLSNKEERQPFFCMFIDPEFDASGKPIGGLVIGDFLDKREKYAAPNPSHMSTGTSKFNHEYPGREPVPTAPILNGFDLTNWAQVPSGKRRFVFMSRPISNVPFLQLPDEDQRRVFLDTTINLTEHEVYTLHVLQKDFNTKENTLYVRQENFHKQPFSDTLSYVNFYNLSAKGYWQAPASAKPGFENTWGLGNQFMRFGIRDTMNVYLTHIAVDTNANGQILHKRIPEFSYQLAASLYRNNTDPKVSTYHGLPVFMRMDEQIKTHTWQYVQFVAPLLDPKTSSSFPEPPEVYNNTIAHLLPWKSRYAIAQFDHARYNPNRRGNYLPGLTLNVHSGIYNPRTFGIISSIEVINEHIYLTSVQRRYPQPIY